MVNRNLILSLHDQSVEDELSSLFSAGDVAVDELDINNLIFPESEAGIGQGIDIGNIIKGRIVRLDKDQVIIDLGFKSEGTIPRNEWDEEADSLEVGQEIKVLVEDLENEQGRADDPSGLISVSFRKAKVIIAWLDLVDKVSEGHIVTGKGGLLVDIGVPVFLPASQVDIRRPGDIGEYIGRVVQCEILKIDKERRNIVVSRRSLIEKERTYAQQKLMAELEVGQVRKGVVKNIADFGAFVDLGGIDGLLHMVLTIDSEKGKIGLGLKQLLPNPWDDVEEKYPINTVHKGEVVNVMNYGAFVKLEPGIEGLVHISEMFIELEEGIDGLLHVSDMSWTRKISHPNEVLEKGQELKCRILAVDTDRRRIALPNRYQPGQLIKGKVTKITNFGVFVGLEDGLEGLLHISELSDEKIENPEDLVNVGDELEVKVLRVDTDERKIGLSRKRVDWTPEEEAKAAEKEGGAAGTERVSASVSSTPDANLQGGLGNSGPLIQTAGMKAEAEAEAKAKEEAEAK